MTKRFHKCDGKFVFFWPAQNLRDILRKLSENIEAALLLLRFDRALRVFDDLLLHFLGCKDESRGRATCIKLVKEMGIQVCYTDVAPLKAKLERSCGETCKFCKYHKMMI